MSASGHKLVVHHLNNSRSLRVLCLLVYLLEELEVPYEIKYYRRDTNLQAPKELLVVNPLGKAPVITDGDVTLAESGAIIQYIINKYRNGRVIPIKEGKSIDLYFTQILESPFMPLLVDQLFFSMVPVQAPIFLRLLLRPRPLFRPIFSIIDAKLIAGLSNTSLKYVEDTLEKSNTGWFAGGPNPTMADYMMSFGLDAVAERRPDLVGPKTKAWLERVHERAYERVVAYIDGKRQKAKL